MFDTIDLGKNIQHRNNDDDENENENDENDDHRKSPTNTPNTTDCVFGH